MKDKLIQKVNEFCKNGNLELYRDILKDIFLKIGNANCKISARYDSDLSNHISNNDYCLIQISLRRKYDKPIHIIWIILHEFGHHLSGPIKKQYENNIELLIKSEQNAWNLAENEIHNYPELLIESVDFNEFKEKELESYYNKL
ncbi:MAG: hypothetical protein Q8N03_07950 [Ignavibacteria bacterium]|nr:hypothetical protein [Ignavibacteria bacterium]